MDQRNPVENKHIVAGISQFQRYSTNGGPEFEYLAADHAGIAGCSQFMASWQLLSRGGVKTLRMPARSPNLNAYSERWVRSAKEECLSKLVLFGEGSLRRAMREYVVHYHAERNHQGKSNILLFPRVTEIRCEKAVECRQRLGGLLRYYHREAA
jgi:hypothetical protein